jgi:hypothetical protein
MKTLKIGQNFVIIHCLPVVCLEGGTQLRDEENAKG